MRAIPRDLLPRSTRQTHEIIVRVEVECRIRPGVAPWRAGTPRRQVYRVRDRDVSENHVYFAGLRQWDLD